MHKNQIYIPQADQANPGMTTSRVEREQEGEVDVAEVGEAVLKRGHISPVACVARRTPPSRSAGVSTFTPVARREEAIASDRKVAVLAPWPRAPRGPTPALFAT